MKKWGIFIVVCFLALGALHATGNIYRYELYDLALSFEADRAGLTLKQGRFDKQSFAYLESDSSDDKPTMLMLHGFGGSKENWLRYAGQLNQDFHIIALDLAGHGDNARDMTGAYGVSDQVSFVNQVVESLELDSFHLVGNSMGGAIASLFSVMHPEKVKKVVLISPAGVHDIPSEMDKALETGSNPLIARSEVEFQRLLDFVMEDKPFIPAPVERVEAERAVSRAEINARIFSYLRKDLETGIVEKLRQIKAPVLIIWGDQDRAIHVDNIDRYATLIPDATKLVFEDIGHVAMIEVPAKTADATRAFIYDDAK